MITHEIEGGCNNTSDVIRVSGINDADNFSVSLAAVGVRRCIIRVGGWLGINLFLQHEYGSATRVCDVGVPFYMEAMSSVAGVTSLAV